MSSPLHPGLCGWQGQAAWLRAGEAPVDLVQGVSLAWQFPPSYRGCLPAGSSRLFSLKSEPQGLCRLCSPKPGSHLPKRAPTRESDQRLEIHIHFDLESPLLGTCCPETEKYGCRRSLQHDYRSEKLDVARRAPEGN